MKKAPIPANESKRLQALRDLQILDSEPEKAYDDIVQIAAGICQTPIALVSLIDSERQWFKAKVGLRETESARDLSFCGHAIHHTDLFIIADATKDERFADNPFVTGQFGLRFYAGAPILTSDGYALGTLCLVDQKARELTEEQKSALTALARQVAAQIELRRVNQKLATSIEQVTSSAKVIAEQQMKLIRAARLEAVGTLAAGVAHEINNPLAIIIGKSCQLIDRLKQGAFEPERALSSLETIEKTAARIAKIVKDLMVVSREEQHDQVVACDVGTLFEQALSLSRERLNAKGIEVRVGPSTRTEVRCRPVHVTQVLINLINNAIEAVEETDSRWIELATELSEADTSSSGSRLRLRVIDSGPGIPETIRERIMEPFFTTKDVGRGQGLGLSVSRVLVEEMGGRLWLDETASHTTFVIEFSIADSDHSVLPTQKRSA